MSLIDQGVVDRLELAHIDPLYRLVHTLLLRRAGGVMIDDRHLPNLDGLRVLFHEPLKFIATLILINQTESSNTLRSDFVDPVADVIDQVILFHLVQPLRDRLLMATYFLGDVRAQVTAFHQLLEDPPVRRELKPHHITGHVGAT